MRFTCTVRVILKSRNKSMDMDVGFCKFQGG